MPSTSRLAFLAGLFLTTLATLTLELLATRLLSVLTWYHLSFFAVSTAMFGMSAGSVHVYLAGGRYDGERAGPALARAATALALVIPLAHALMLHMPLDVGVSVRSVLGLVGATLALAAPFFFSGVAVTVALTRVPGPTGLVYAVDLAGAALGSLLVIPLLHELDISSATIACASLAALGALCFRLFAGTGSRSVSVALILALALAAAVNARVPQGLRVIHSKGHPIDRANLRSESWTIHGQLLVKATRRGPPWYWGPGRGAWDHLVDIVPMAIDGVAGTFLTVWDGDPESLSWVQHDLTTLPYWIRPRGEVAVIGVGGGRDVLTAIWAGSRSIVGLEVNGALVDLLRGELRDEAGLADRGDVSLVHDEARSWLTRTERRFDVLQMSLIDTWAATGAGAFTLSENGLYTVEAWQLFLDRLSPRGVFSVSRWHSPAGGASETSRLVALATATLLERGVAEPARQLVLVAAESGPMATLLVGNDPFDAREIERIVEVQERYGFTLLLAPGAAPADPLLGSIAASRSSEELAALLRDLRYDYSPPRDDRPYFFNILRPSRVLDFADYDLDEGVLAKGNLLATGTLAALWAISLLLVTAVILLPLVRSGRPSMRPGAFVAALSYFALIGAGYMLVQVPFMQRFSVYLGHPTYTAAVTLFSMILATGAGSWLSDRLGDEQVRRARIAIPLGIAAMLAAGTAALQPLIERTIAWGLFGRCLVVVGFVGALALPLGVCFPLGLRLVRSHSDDATPWMWGLNGASAVLAAVTAVAISMWAGIRASLLVAALAYALLALPAGVLGRRS